MLYNYPEALLCPILRLICFVGLLWVEATGKTHRQMQNGATEKGKNAPAPATLSVAGIATP